ncbi:MAG: tRNA dihydrouridine synthase [Patescibacteria group bacterium]
MANFWSNLKKPFFVLAPMDDVTDIVFRDVVEKVYPPDVFFTEFVSIEGLASKGRENVIRKLKRNSDSSKPQVAQIWGRNLDSYIKASNDIKKMGFDGIDINMGCPERGIVRRGYCGGLIGQYSEVSEIIKATKKGAGDIPVSVKTRIGLDHIITDEWISFLLEQDLAAITIHARTVKEMSKVQAHWDEIKKVVELRDKLSPETLIIGNGDVESYTDGIKLVKDTGVDGIMIGRGIFKDIFVFDPEKRENTQKDMINILLYHLDKYETESEYKSFQILKKFFKIYVNSFEGANDLRVELMNTNSVEEVRNIILNKNF